MNAPPVSRDENESLQPEGELAKMAPRRVGPDGIQFVPGEGVSIHSADDDFSMNLSFRLQTLYTLKDPDKGLGPTQESIQIRRARAQLFGHAFGKHNKYKLELAMSPSDVAIQNNAVTTSPLLDAYVVFDYLRDLTIQAGQYKVPYDRMRVGPDTDRELVDYSGATTEFSLDRDIGVEVNSSNLFGAGFLRYHAGIFSGKGRNSYALTNMGLMYLARVEVLPLGFFDDYSEADFHRTGPRISIGGAYAHIQDGLRQQGTMGVLSTDGGTSNYDMAEADLAFKCSGFSAVGGFYYRKADRKGGGATTAVGAAIPVEASRDGVGYVAQGGYLLPRTPVEVAARYAGVAGKSEAGHNELKRTSELGGGVSYYFARHQLKLQADYFRLYNNGDISTGAHQVRLQLQIVL